MLNLNDNKFLIPKMTKYLGFWLIPKQPVTAKRLENLTLKKQTNDERYQLDATIMIYYHK